MMFLELYLSFFQIGLLSFGGGYASLPIIQQAIVEQRMWLTVGEFVDIVTISQMTPGPIGINAATFVGTKVAGFGGALSATLGFVSPSLIIILTLVYLYQKYKTLSVVQALLNGLRPAVIALIAASALTILLVALFGEVRPTNSLSALNVNNLIIFGVALALLRLRKMDAIVVLMISGVLALGLALLG